jgi:hypothetical protein
MNETREQRPSIETSFDLRSDESLVVITSNTDRQYPSKWSVFGIDDFLLALSTIDHCSSVLIDRTDIRESELIDIAARSPRLVGIVPIDVDHERSIRRMVTNTYPFSELWTIPTAFGKVLLSPGIVGRPVLQWIEDDMNKRYAF